MPSERGAAAFRRGSVGNPRLTRAKRDRAGFGPCHKHGHGPAADQVLLLTLYARCVQASTADGGRDLYGDVTVPRDQSGLGASVVSPPQPASVPGVSEEGYHSP